MASKIEKLNSINEKVLEKFLLEISNIEGGSGDEEKIANYIKSELKKFGYTKFKRDNLGTISVIIKGSENGAPKTIIESHMDAPSFMVKEITKDGFLKFSPVGGWWSHVLLGQMLKVINSKNKSYLGIIGAKPPHVVGINERNKVIPIEKLFIDLGSKSKKETIDKFGINIGDRVTPYVNAIRLNNTDLFAGNGYDDRAGCAVNFMLLKWIKEKKIKPKGDIIITFSTQEEVGLRGAKTASQMFNADIGFGLDVTIAFDTPGMEDGNVKLRTGVSLGVMDGRTIGSKTLFNFMEKLATNNKIKYQPDVLPYGGTDAAEIQRAHDGSYAMSLSIPMRYLHTHHETVSIDDIKETIRILEAYIENINKEIYENEIKFK